MTISIPQNIFSNIPLQLPEEAIEALFQNKSIRIERILSKGHHSGENEWYDQTQDEWVLLLQGEAKLEFSDPPKIVALKPGDYLLIPSHVKHRVAWTLENTASIWLAIHIY